MRYDIGLINELCREIGLRSTSKTPDEVAIEIEESAILRFENSEEEDDCLVEFVGTAWHAHGDFLFSDRHGYYVELDYLDVITGIVEGKILICELWNHGKLADRWLVHRDFVDEFQYMDNGDEIRIRGVSSKKLHLDQAAPEARAPQA